MTTVQEPETTLIKVASASLNQTVYDFSRNVMDTIIVAIDRAVADGADILSLPELSLTGYAADDYHQWNKDNSVVWPLLQTIANYAAKQNPNLVVSVGAPWHYANKSLPADDVAYNVDNRPFNCQFTITGGHVAAISAKPFDAHGPTEYEGRQFTFWPEDKGTIQIALPDGSNVPFGHPIVALGDGEKNITLLHEICAAGWWGLHNDLTINQHEQESRHIVELSGTHDIGVVLNPSASKPEPAINKEHIRADGLCKTGSEHCGLFVYTNYLGSESGTYAAEGSQLFAQDGEIIHHGQRYNFSEVSYSSVAAKVPVARRGKPDVVLHHEFNATPAEPVGAEAAFDKAFRAGELTLEQLKYEEYLRSIALWLRDYMLKQDWPCQGYVISLSGGKDSAYGAVAISMMVDLEVQENGVEGFFNRFSHLKYKDEVLEISRTKGEAAAIRAIKDNILTCVYLPSENSSDRTRNAAQTLVEGGTLPDGTKVDGIGGKFIVAPIQGMLDEQTAAQAGLNLTQMAKDNWAEILGNKYTQKLFKFSKRLRGKIGEKSQQMCQDLARAKMLREINAYVNAARGSNPKLPDYIARYCQSPVPTWSDPKYDIGLQNDQARIRLPIPWALAAKEGKMALVTSNQSEALLGYTTAGGDMHMGGANPIGGMPKENALTESLAYFEKHGLVGFPAVKALHYVNLEKPTAELRKEVEGEAPQTDEKDLGFTYKQADWLANELIINRRKPAEVLPEMLADPLFPKDISALRKILINCTNRWAAAQFKRIMGTLAPHLGNNLDPHQAVRTTVLADHFKTNCAEMTIDILAAEAGGETGFLAKYGVPLDHAHQLAQLDDKFKTALIKWPLEDLRDAKKWNVFPQSPKWSKIYSSLPTPTHASAAPTQKLQSSMTGIAP